MEQQTFLSAQELALLSHIAQTPQSTRYTVTKHFSPQYSIEETEDLLKHLSRCGLLRFREANYRGEVLVTPKGRHALSLENDLRNQHPCQKPGKPEAPLSKEKKPRKGSAHDYLIAAFNIIFSAAIKAFPDFIRYIVDLVQKLFPG